MGQDSRLDQIQSEIAQSSQLAQLDWPKRSAALERLEKLDASDRAGSRCTTRGRTERFHSMTCCRS